MKKNRTIIIISLLLIALAGYLIYQNKSGSIRKEDRDFAVKDTASVTKIFIADRSGPTVTLEKLPDHTWTVNKKYKARKDGIDLLLDCFNRIRVQTRVSKAAYNNVIRELSTTGIKCEIYINNEDKPHKVYYVGGSTQDVLGTFMMIENSTVPFVTEVPGFDGYLTPRYSAKERDWQETILLSYTPEQIKSLSIQYNIQPDKSFTIEKTGSSYSVISPISNQAIADPDTFKIRLYLNIFRNLHFEAWDRSFSDQQTDSLRHAMPATILAVTDTSGRKVSLPLYPKPITLASLAQKDSLGRPLKYDLDRMYAFIEDGKELVTVQYAVFNKVFATINDFDLSKRSSRITHN